MKNELDDLLCERYPKIFRDRHGDMRATAMCWGFEVGDGWFNIINQFCNIVQWKIDQSRKDRLRALLHNRALQRGSLKLMVTSMGGKKNEEPSQWLLDRAVEELKKNELCEVPETITQLVATQVKEKFGSLRFYYHGGNNDYIDGVHQMMESMSGVTCEECGAPGKRRSGGWIRCLCDEHAVKEGRDVSDLVEVIENED